MTKKFLQDSFGWGFGFWLIGYLLGIVLFFIAPPSMIGWIIMPIGVAITFWVLSKKVKSDSFQYYILLAVIWTLTAIICDYLFLVKVFQPVDGYYKADVYFYYALTFILPLLIGWRQIQKR